MRARSRVLFNALQEYSFPLIFGVVLALGVANLDYSLYHRLVYQPWGGHPWPTLEFVVNNVVMVFFFGLATKELTEALLPGGSLHPLRRAINPLVATLGGVGGPVALFFLLTHLLGLTHLNRGWGIPTATDIALAWLGARVIFGKKHPAIDYLLLLAIVDDGIGLGIITIFYSDPQHPVQGGWLGLVVLAMVIAYGMRKKRVAGWLWYIAIPGMLAWIGLAAAHLHPALALVFVIPFLPGAASRAGMFMEGSKKHPSCRERFAQQVRVPMDWGLLLFGFANAGVRVGALNEISLVILVALVGGKLLGVILGGKLASWLGYDLPHGMEFRELVVVGLLAGMGLTVALFMCSVAYTGELLAVQGAAKMGALLSVGGGLIAWVVVRADRQG